MSSAYIACPSQHHARRLAHVLGGKAGESPLDMGPKLETTGGSGNVFRFLFRLVLGTTAGAYFFILPIYMWLKNLVWPRNAPGF